MSAEREFTRGGGGRHPLVVVRVHAHAVILQVEGKLTELHVFELVLMEVGPTPQTGVDHMREAFPACHLQTDRSETGRQVRDRQTDRSEKGSRDRQTGQRQTDRSQTDRQTGQRQTGQIQTDRQTDRQVTDRQTALRKPPIITY